MLDTRGAEYVRLSLDLEVEPRRIPLADVRAAFRHLERGHTRGKIVLPP